MIKKSGDVITLSKYNHLWKYFENRKESSIRLSFEEIKIIAGIELDHSFLNYKKELPQYGYKVGKISLKNETVLFNKLG